LAVSSHFTNFKVISMIHKILLLLLLGIAPSGWAATILIVGPTPISVNVGDTFVVAVSLFDLQTDQTPPPQIAGFSFDVLFPTFLEVVSAPAEEGFFSLAGCCYFPGFVDNVNGVISGIGDVDIFGGVTNVVDTLVQIEFLATGTGTGQITLDNAGLTDPDGNAVSLDSVTAADVSATAPAPVPEPATWSMAGLSVAIAIACSRRLARSSGR
jgi:hypothetical protein